MNIAVVQAKQALDDARAEYDSAVLRLNVAERAVEECEVVYLKAQRALPPKVERRRG